MKRLPALAALATLVVGVPSQAQETAPRPPSGGEQIAVYGLLSSGTCENWTYERRAGSVVAKEAEQSILGFVSAYNWYVRASRGDVARGAGPTVMTDWLDRHCQANPQHPMIEAMARLVRHLQGLPRS